MALRHKPGCNPQHRAPYSCPCGVLDAYYERLEAMAADEADRQSYERGAA